MSLTVSPLTRSEDLRNFRLHGWVGIVESRLEIENLVWDGTFEEGTNSAGRAYRFRIFQRLSEAMSLRQRRGSALGLE